MKHGAPKGAKSNANRTTGACVWPGLRNKMIPGVFEFAILPSGLSHPMTGQTRSAPDGQLLLTGGTIYVSPTENPITNGVVLIRNGKIAAVGGRRGSVRVPNGGATVDCSGLTVAAGFWNGHVHFSKHNGRTPRTFRRPNASQAFDLGSPWGNMRLNFQKERVAH